MTRKTRSMIVLVAASALGLTWFAAFAENGLQSKPTVVAVVSIEQVWSNIEARRYLKADLEGERERLLGENAEKQKEIEAIQQDIQWLPDGSDEQQKKLEEVAEKAINLKGWLEYQQGKLNRLELIRYEQLYRNTLDAVKAVAERAAVDLVLFKERYPQTKTLKSTRDFLALIGNRKVLYAKDELDLTEQVITRMNNMVKDSEQEGS